MSEEEESAQIYEETTKRPFFNFAESSLKRIDFILLQLGILSVYFDASDSIKQRKKIALIKTLLQYATPLAPNLFDKDFNKKILELKMEKSSVIKSRNQNYGEMYSETLEQELDNYIIEISMKLQSKGYFMPKVEEDEDDY